MLPQQQMFWCQAILRELIVTLLEHIMRRKKYLLTFPVPFSFINAYFITTAPSERWVWIQPDPILGDKAEQEGNARTTEPEFCLIIPLFITISIRQTKVTSYKYHNPSAKICISIFLNKYSNVFTVFPRVIILLEAKCWLIQCHTSIFTVPCISCTKYHYAF